MKASKSSVFARLALLTGAIIVTGCETSQRSDVTRSEPSYGPWSESGDYRAISSAAPTTVAPAPMKSEPAPVARAEPVRAQTPARSASGCSPAVGPDQQATTMAYPTGDQSTSALLLTQVSPRHVRAGQSYTTTVYACNLTRMPLQNVVVTQDSIANLRLGDASPAGSRSASGATQWALGDLGPGETKSITFSATAPEVGTSSCCMSASYNNTLCSTVQVVQPALAVLTKGPAEILQCEPLAYVIEVRNSGTGPAENVIVRGALPAGVTTTDGRNAVEFNVGTLAQGETRSFNVACKAAKSGRFETFAEANGSGAISAKSQPVVTLVKQPVLELAVSCQDRTYIGRDATFEVMVKNTGDAAARNTVVTSPLPAGAQFVRATEGGALQGQNVVWTIPSLASGESKSASVTLKTPASGSLRASATAQGVCAPAVSKECSTSVVGIPAILLECVDIDDPLEVGGQTTYVITVTNQGSAADSNIRVVCDLPSQQDFVSATGATSGSAQGRTITFAPLASLAPKAKAEYRVTVKANAEGDARFKTRLTSDQFKNPIEETESTNLYK